MPENVLSDDGEGIALSTLTASVTFNVTGLIANSTDPAAVHRLAAVNHLAVYSPPYLVAAGGFDGKQYTDPYDYATHMTTLSLTTGTTVAYNVASIYHLYPPRALKIDSAAGMVYVLTSEGSVLRAPLDHYARESAEVVANVFSPSYYTDCAIDTLSTGFAVVVCYNQTKQNVISLRIANCEAAATADACLSDPHYCTWYLYGQSCQLRTYAARVLCAGANATHCTTTVPSIGAVVPGAGYGGTAVNITVGTLWQDASLRCVFGVNASAVATYDAATEVVSCTAPPGNVGTVIVNVRYLAEDIVPISAATFTYVAECTVPDDCTVVHGAAGECRTWRCDVADGKCTADPAAAATPCTAVAGDGCVLGPAPNGTAADGLCTGTGECVVRAAAVAVPLCEEASLAYVDGAHAMALGGIGEACTTDADCGDGLALGCAAVGCLPGTGQCGVVWMADGSPCTPTAADEPPCTQAQLGMCESGR
ncbi:MAG: IPT/TIG domain-containing protein, partial [Dehalococcoidia bacterium]|nr:IPT/TIG domain-containing protein [Dehalococcoidia bacterium]